MSNVKLDYVFRCETALGVKFGPEIECELHAEYDEDHDTFNLVQLDCDNITMLATDKSRSTEMHVIFDRANYDLENNTQLRTDAWRQHAENEYEGV